MYATRSSLSLVEEVLDGVTTSDELQKIESDVDEIFTQTINESKPELYRPVVDYQPRVPIINEHYYQPIETFAPPDYFIQNNNSITYEDSLPIQTDPMSSCLVMNSLTILKAKSFFISRCCHKRFANHDGQAQIWIRSVFTSATIQVIFDNETF